MKSSPQSQLTPTKLIIRMPGSAQSAASFSDCLCIVYWSLETRLGRFVAARTVIKMGSIQKVAACVLVFVIAIAHVEIISTSEIPITFSLIVSYGRFGYNSSPGIPAIDLALEHIHSSGVLGEYKLQYSTVRDSEVACHMWGSCIRLETNT